jgi:ribosome biogenesis GTPase / thiamine phosphate phosphatase
MVTEVLLTGLIIRSQSGFFTVDTAQGRLICRLRGKLKQGPVRGDIASVGDRVWVSLQADGSGAIEKVEPRLRTLARTAPGPKGEYQQVLLANPDQLMVVFACAHPDPHLRMVDRFLVLAEKQRIPATIVANKADLVTRQHAEEIFGHYPALGYPVIYTSAHTGDGIEQLRGTLTGQISIFAGPSGVGKSSLLNALLPGLSLQAGEVNAITAKGSHTTVVRELFPLVGGGYLADSPGIRSLALWDTQPEELDGYFPELRDLVDQCQFNDCTHRTEPGCAVLQAVERGAVNTERYYSYIRMRFGGDD